VDLGVPIGKDVGPGVPSRGPHRKGVFFAGDEVPAGIAQAVDPTVKGEFELLWFEFGELRVLWDLAGDFLKVFWQNASVGFRKLKRGERPGLHVVHLQDSDSL
jgi:hypothetical protein